MRRLLTRSLAALALLVTMALSFYAGRQSAPTMTVKLDNPRVTVTESSTPEHARRDTYVRPTDQIIVFIDAADYESIDSSGRATLRHRKPGDIVWHSKGELAPLLVNKGKAYRNLIIAVK